MLEMYEKNCRIFLVDDEQTIEETLDDWGDYETPEEFIKAWYELNLCEFERNFLERNNLELKDLLPLAKEIKYIWEMG